MHSPKFSKLARALPNSVPFVGPEALERQRGSGFLARLGANESGFGPSPRVTNALQNAASSIWMYGDPECIDLRTALAAHHKTTLENIVAGEGIDGLLVVLARLFVSEGDAVVTSLGAYPTFDFHILGSGGILHRAPFLGDHEDPDALVTLAHQVAPKLLYLSNPNNPMGSFHSGAKIEAMIDALPQDTLLVLDEAYSELAPKETIPHIDPNDPRVIRMRTFSKAYGLAGLRVGYAISAPQVIKGFERLRNHFGLGRLAQTGALAALEDQSYLAKVVQDVAQARHTIAQIATDNGLIPLTSGANFVAIDCGQDGDFAFRILTYLAQEGIFVRKPGIAPQNRTIRVSVGPKDAIDFLRSALPLALQRAKDSKL
ncbi:MAG: histidinol-phosphate aminotransferase [Paracoccaceae bacterium]|jgi:histidinol-phosphate aminotransferase